MKGMSARPGLLSTHLMWMTVSVAIALGFWLLGMPAALGAAAAQPRTYYVDASGGDDAADGLSSGTAWKSLGKVNSEAFQAGDQVLFARGGHWRGRLVISSSGSEGNPVTFGAYGPGTAPVIDGEGSESAIRIESNYVLVRDLIATGGTDFGIFVVSTANFATLERVVSHDHKYGIGLISSKTSGVGHVVRDCEVYGSGMSGIVFDARGVTIRGCLIYDNGGQASPGLGHGIYATNGEDGKSGDGCDDAILEGNEIYGTERRGNGINFKCGRGVIRYNRVHANEDGIHLEDQDPGMPTGTVEIYGNVVYDNNGGIVLYDYKWNPEVRVRIYNNTTYNNNRWAGRDEPRELDLQIDVQAGVELKNNIFYNDTCLGGDHDCYALRSLVSQRAMDSDHNCVFKDDSVVAYYAGSIHNWEGWKRETGGDAGSIFDRPSFVGAQDGDFHLQAESACVDSGVDVGLTEDADGVPIPQGAAPDIGAFEFREAGSAPTFADVPFDHWAHDEIEKLYQEGFIAGCSEAPLLYCPEDTMIRAESAVFVERGIWGAGYLPPEPEKPIFADVGLHEWYAKWASALWEDGYTAGCGRDPLVYCPMREHTREEGTVFFLRMMEGPAYVPPEPVGLFADVPVESWGAKWIEAAYNADLIPACEQQPELRFCPHDPLDRAMAAHMMVQAKGLSQE